jgi:hypothetical protein
MTADQKATMGSDLRALIERVSELKGPCRETDGLIYIATHIPVERTGRIDHEGGCVGWWPKDAPYQSAIEVPRYTESVDAALTLVPEGFKWKAGYGRHVPHVAELRDYRDQPILGTFIGECDSNRAIALCIASLRARLP